MGKRERKGHVLDLGVDGKIILKWIVKQLVGGVNWIALALDRDGWHALVNAVMNIRVP
jgi:hypothetical protein